MLNKWNLKVGEFASTEESRYTLKAIRVEQGATVATNGHYLAWISRPKIEARDFPQVDGFPGQDESLAKPVLVSSELAAKVAKALPRKVTIPVLANAAMHVNGDERTTLCVTDLETPQVFSERQPSGQFPQYENAFPRKDPVITFDVDARYLAKIAKFAAEFSGADSKNGRAPVLRITLSGPEDVIRFDVQRETDDQGATFLLMPIRSDLAMRNIYGWKPEREAEPDADAVNAEAKDADGEDMAEPDLSDQEVTELAENQANEPSER